MLQIILFHMDTAVNNALRVVNSVNLRRYTELQCPKAWRRRLKAAQRLVGVLLGDPNVMFVTNTKGVAVTQHVTLTCIQDLYDPWRVRDVYTLTQVERHCVFTTKFLEASGDTGWSPTKCLHWCLAHSTFFFLRRSGELFFNFPPSPQNTSMGLTREGSKSASRVGPW